MKYISLFAGIGGFDLALNRLGHKCVYANEWDKYAAQIYEKNFKHLPDQRSITDVPVGEIPDHELLVGGFPCQSFSVAGKRRGFEDTRGTLFFEICRILRAKRPAYLLLENVKGLLSHDAGKTFSTIIGSLDELGYDCQWQVLNSKNHGVPQNRERIFIVGHLRGKPRPEVFPITTDSREDVAIDTKRGTSENCIASTLTVHYTKNQHGNQYVAENNEEERYIIHNVYGGFGEEKPREFRKYSPTIRTPKGGGHIPNVVQGISVRRLTPLECERLQGFPDGWTEGISDTQRYKCLGNAVTVNVIEAIASKFCD